MHSPHLLALEAFPKMGENRGEKHEPRAFFLLLREDKCYAVVAYPLNLRPQSIVIYKRGRDREQDRRRPQIRSNLPRPNNQTFFYFPLFYIYSFPTRNIISVIKMLDTHISRYILRANYRNISPMYADLVLF